ncbi:hypothetical protein RvY_02592 [Ramazzottius varieornatus]|uniref:t-SNARE coiled-coil homology domain-containing protein n=1 Tax=Ramazzottius varieornatus TaxID=947166 RepID=A0A1D1UVD9_RAMVA|nr:hypothetical protein RvY_02592 [Ramazzottius varieornatus]
MLTMSGYDRFGVLADELKALIASMQRKLDRRLPSLPAGEERKRVMRELDGEADDAQRLLREMQLEADSDLQAGLSYRQQLNAQMKDYRTQVDRIRSSVTHLKSEEQDRRGGGAMDNSNPFFVQMDPREAANRNQLLQGRAILERTQESLGRSLAVSAETEQIGTGVVGELHLQRETLENTRSRLEETNHDLTKSRGIIRSMGRRIVTNKIFLIVIIGIEVVILAGVTYWKFFSPKK